MQKALAAAKAAGNHAMGRALESALATMSAHASEAGVRMPAPREPKATGSRRKKTAAA
jgi:hypothetical protein